ncbi:Tricalbin-2 [Elasticomyces elasticus]|nr:Tricalbin-2 [Elasticomyces elasticus]
MLNGLRGHANELNIQAVVQAAQDPNSRVSVGDAERTIHDEAKRGGAEAYMFDPNASAEEKARQNVPPELQGLRKHQTTAIVSDQDDGHTAGYDLPPATKEGALPPPSRGTAAVNAAADKEEEWGKVGWAPRFGNPGDHDEEPTMLDHQTLLESKLDDKFFGGQTSRVTARRANPDTDERC